MTTFQPQSVTPTSHSFWLWRTCSQSQGRGTVCTGRVEQGIVKKGDEVGDFGPWQEASEVRDHRHSNVQHRSPRRPSWLHGRRAVPWYREGCSVPRSGDLCTGATTTHTKFKANIYFAKKDEGGRNNPVMPGYMPVFYFRTCDVTGKI